MDSGEGRGKGDNRYRRGPSPGRWEPAYGGPRPRSSGRSPRRGPADYGSPRADISPARPRQPPRGAAPQRGPPSPKRQKRNFSSPASSPSRGDSDSGTSSSSDDSRGPPKGSGGVPLPGAMRKEMVHLKQRERELLDKLAEAHDEAEQERAAKETLQAKAEFLGAKIKSIAERSKTRGSMLMQLMTAVANVGECKGRLREAEAELESVLHVAMQAMHDEENQFERGKEAPNGAPAGAAQPEQYAAPQQQHQLATAPAEQYVPEAEGGEGLQEQQGGWAEGSFADASGQARGKFKPFKFHINL